MKSATLERLVHTFFRILGLGLAAIVVLLVWHVATDYYEHRDSAPQYRGVIDDRFQFLKIRKTESNETTMHYRLMTSPDGAPVEHRVDHREYDQCAIGQHLYSQPGLFGKAYCSDVLLRLDNETLTDPTTGEVINPW